MLKAAFACTLILLAGFTYQKLRHPPHDADLYHDTLALAQVVQKSSIVSFKRLSSDEHSDAALSFYLGRWACVSIDNKDPHEFMVFSIADSRQPPPGYEETAADLKLYRLYKRSDRVASATAVDVALLQRR